MPATKDDLKKIFTGHAEFI